MKPNVFMIVFASSIAFAQAQSATIRSAVKAVSCSPKTGASVEQEVCAAVIRVIGTYQPKRVAANRALPQTTIEFSATWMVTSLIASVLVTDPIGKNTVKLIFSVPIEPAMVARRSVEALDHLLQTPVTRRNVGWITVVPQAAGSRGGK